jgi:hypothetical protein
MKHVGMIGLLVALYITGCNKDDKDSDDNNGGNNGGTLSITSTSPEFTFWGDELTINGTGFSATKADNTVYIKGNRICSTDTTWQKAEVVNASATKLTVKVPLVIKQNDVPCGHDYGYVRVTVNNKSVTADSACKFVGPLRVSNCLPYGVVIGTYPNTIRPGDSATISADLYTLYTSAYGLATKAKIYLNGSHINAVAYTKPGATCGGLNFLLNPAVWADLNNCTIPAGYNGGNPARKMTFTVKLDGTNKEASTDIWVLNQPNTVITGINGPSSVSKSAGGNPSVTVNGRNFYISNIKWVYNGGSFTTSPPPHDFASTSLSIYIPLSLMQANTSYTAIGQTTCGKEITLFGVSIID